MSNADANLRALRGVHEEPYLKRGKRVFVAVDSHGELIAEKLVRADAPAWRVDAAQQDLWDELNEEDPIMPHERGPVFLKLI